MKTDIKMFTRYIVSSWFVKLRGPNVGGNLNVFGGPHISIFLENHYRYLSLPHKCFCF